MKKILVIDDDVSMTRLLSEELKDHGVDPDAVVLDMRMPGINGLETFKKIKALDKRAEIFLTTGYAQDNMVEDMIKSGVDGYISKNSDQYIKMVASLIVAILEA
jgi:DNA-binding NarL/FixJ family response regulator